MVFRHFGAFRQCPRKLSSAASCEEWLLCDHTDQKNWLVKCCTDGSLFPFLGNCDIIFEGPLACLLPIWPIWPFIIIEFGQGTRSINYVGDSTEIWERSLEDWMHCIFCSVSTVYSCPQGTVYKSWYIIQTYSTNATFIEDYRSERCLCVFVQITAWMNQLY